MRAGLFRSDEQTGLEKDGFVWEASQAGVLDLILAIIKAVEDLPKFQ